MNKKIVIVLVLVLGVLAAEVFLRNYYGFCDAVLFEEDPNFEYIAKPNQDRFRYRNHIKYNSNSMRSEEVDTTAYIIIGFGDSVLNGGMQTDNDDLATTILSDTLSKIQGRKVQFLNVSSPSWGPDNAFEYLRKYGRFGASTFYLFVSSHDAHDTMTFEKTVDAHDAYPGKQYPLALIELFDRYLVPRVMALFNSAESEKEYLAINEQNETDSLNVGFLNFLAYCEDSNIPLTIYLHPEKVEVESGSYNSDGQEIIQFAKGSGIPLILALDNGLSLSDFRDDIHINAAGQKKMAEIVLNHIKDSQSITLH